ncbi:hypothetical protein PSAB6_50141 [Paraburkholderia sabiae]|nr:hypothetical protein PSAB6_50141 [Paraburkholderia sabiae]
MNRRNANFQVLPAVLISGTPEEVDRYLVEVLWGTPGPAPSMDDVVRWIGCLHKRGDDFGSHQAACYYWLCEHRAGCPPWFFPK